MKNFEFSKCFYFRILPKPEPVKREPMKTVLSNGPKKCEFCSFKTNETTMFMHHRASKHFACPTCGKVHTSVSQVLEHQLKDHKNAEKYQLTICQCYYCKYVPDTKPVEIPDSEPKSPEVGEKDSKILHKCELCDFQADTANRLVYHKSLQHFLCPNCPAFFQSLKHLLDHQNAMHAKATKWILKQCSQCDYISRFGDVSRHESTHHKRYVQLASLAY